VTLLCKFRLTYAVTYHPTTLIFEGPVPAYSKFPLGHFEWKFDFENTLAGPFSGLLCDRGPGRPKRTRGLMGFALKDLRMHPPIVGSEVLLELMSIPHSVIYRISRFSEYDATCFLLGTTGPLSRLLSCREAEPNVRLPIVIEPAVLPRLQSCAGESATATSSAR
jgi:hypothetical protein